MCMSAARGWRWKREGTYLRGHNKRERTQSEAEDPDGDGGVSDEEMTRVERHIAIFLESIGFIALIEDPLTHPGDPMVPASEARADGRAELQTRYTQFRLAQL